MKLPPWRINVASALRKNQSLPNARYLQLATVQSNGRPANRTVVFRGFSPLGQLMIITDLRSQKVQEITQCPWGEVCWYFPHTREQFRIGGQLQVISHYTTDEGARNLRSQVWQEISEVARQQFTWPAPRIPQPEEQSFDVAIADLQEPLSTFCVLCLEADWVDHLELSHHPHHRTLYQRQAGEQIWIRVEVTP